MEGSLGDRFRRARKAAGMTGEQAAKALGVSRSYISAIENGRRTNVSPAFVRKTCDLFWISPSYLLEFPITGYMEIFYELYLIGWLSLDILKDLYGALQEEINRLDLTEAAHKRLQLLGLSTGMEETEYRRPPVGREEIMMRLQDGELPD